MIQAVNDPAGNVLTFEATSRPSAPINLNVKRIIGDEMVDTVILLKN